MKSKSKVLIIGVLCLFFACSFAWASDKGSFSTSPKTNNGKKWRIGYYHGGKYIEYQQTLTATVNALMELGWIKKAKLPELAGNETVGLWSWLANDANSQYVEFVNDAFYSADWNKDKQKETAAAIIKRLSEKKDIDLMIAMGTWAGQDLANDKHSTNTIVLAVSDAMASGIIKSVEDSGYDHVHARVDPFRYERQVRIFHDIIGFRNLGMVYRDTEDGRSYAALDKVETVAKERGFEIVRCLLDPNAEDEVRNQSTIDCYNELMKKKVDAVYVTIQKGVNETTRPKLVEILNTSRVPSFSMAGSEEVKSGFLMSISQAGFKYIGKFYAEVMAKILNGAKPRELGQVFEEPPKIAINLKTAELIGYDPPVDVLTAADEIYQEITTKE